MPVLHKNQIQWAAPEPQKVSLDKPDYSDLAKSLDRFGRAMDEFSQYAQEINDTEAQEKMNQSVGDGLAILEKKQPTDNDFGEALNQFNSDLKTQFDSFDTATKNRFMRDHPTYFEQQELKAKEIIFDKQQKFSIVKAKNLIPLLASNVTEGKSPYETERKKLDNMVAHMDSATAEELVFAFDREVQIGNLKNYIANGAFSDALKMVKNPEESDTFTPQERTDFEIEIQKMNDKAAEDSAERREKALKNFNDGLEKSILTTLLYLYDEDAIKGTNKYAETVVALDKKGKIQLVDEKGNPAGVIDTSDIPVDVRRNAIKQSRDYRQDTEAWRLNTFKANTLADNLKKLYNKNYNKRGTNEIFNDVYQFTQSPSFIYADKEKQKEMYNIIYGEVDRTNEQVIPYSSIREQRLLYGDTFELTQPSGPSKLRQYVFGSRDLQKTSLDRFVEAHPKMGSLKSLGPRAVPQLPIGADPMALTTIQKRTDGSDWEVNSTIGFDEATYNLKKQYKKRTGNEVLDGSELEFLMNQYAAILSYNDNERSYVGLTNATDSQIGLTYNILLGEMERTGQTNVIIGQNMNQENAEQIRKGIFDSFYKLMYNNSVPTLKQEQIDGKKTFYDKLVEGSYGIGSTIGWKKKVTPNDFSVIYSNVLTEDFNTQIKRENK